MLWVGLGVVALVLLHLIHREIQRRNFRGAKQLSLVLILILIPFALFSIFWLVLFLMAMFRVYGVIGLGITLLFIAGFVKLVLRFAS